MYSSIFNRFPAIQAGSLKVHFHHFSTFFAHFRLPCVRPWDNRGNCYTDRKRIQCLSNASKHVHIYLQPFTSYSEILVGNFFLPPLRLTPPYGVAPGTIAINVTRLERGFNACKTPRLYIHLSSAVSQ